MTHHVLILNQNRDFMSQLQAELERSACVVDWEWVEKDEDARKLLHSGKEFAVVVADKYLLNIEKSSHYRAMQSEQSVTFVDPAFIILDSSDQDAKPSQPIFKHFSQPVVIQDLKKGIEEAIDYYRMRKIEHSMFTETVQGSVQVMADILSVIDPKAFTRVKKIADWSTLLGEHLGIRENWQLRISAILSHIGWVTIPHSVQEKFSAGKALEVHERAQINQVPMISSDWVSKIPRLEYVAKVIRYQNKNFDGGGFPVDACKGMDIPVEARVLKILIDACNLTSGRFPSSYVFEKISKNSGYYDPKIFKICQEVFRELWEKSDDQLHGNIEAISLHLLRPGQLLMDDIVTLNGHLILAKGQKISDTQIIKLANYGQMHGIREPIHILREVP